MHCVDYTGTIFKQNWYDDTFPELKSSEVYFGWVMCLVIIVYLNWIDSYYIHY